MVVFLFFFHAIIVREVGAGVYYLETLHLKVSYVADGTSCKVLLITELLDRTWDENFNNWNVFYVNRFYVNSITLCQPAVINDFILFSIVITFNLKLIHVTFFIHIYKKGLFISPFLVHNVAKRPRAVCIKNALEDELNLAEVSLSVPNGYCCAVVCGKTTAGKRCTYHRVYRLFFHFND